MKMKRIKEITFVFMCLMVLAISVQGAERLGQMIYVYPQVNNTYTNITNNYGGGDTFWLDQGSYLEPNTSFADDVNISAGWLYVDENITGGAYINALIECGNIIGADPDFCEDEAGGGGSGENYWVDNGTYVSLNSSYAINADIQGYITASNWSDVDDNICSGTTTYMDGEGNCDTLADLTDFTDTTNEYQQDITGGCDLNQTVIGIVDGGAIGCNDISIKESQISDFGSYYDSLSDLQGAVSNDFHNLGGTDDDDPESISCGIIADNTSNLCEISDTQLTEEQVEDYAWSVTGGTQTRITVTYQDGTDDVDFVVDDMNDDQPDDDSEVPDDITVDTTKWINTTKGNEICDPTETYCWKIYVNASGALIAEGV